MIRDKSVELQENASVKLKLTISKESIQEAYDGLLADYSRKLQIKGFRRGKVPREVLERKFGSSLLAETTEKVIEKSLEEALEGAENKPLSYAIPHVDAEAALELGKDYTYTVSYDTYPEIELPEYRALEVEELQVEIAEEDVSRELEALQEQNSVVVEKERDELEKGDIVTMDFVELDGEGGEIASSRREAFVFEAGTGYNPYKIDDDILGMRREEERILKKSYPADFEAQALAGQVKDLKVKVRALKSKKRPELNDELAQDISEKYKSLEDLKTDLRAKLKAFSEQKVREHNISQILEKVAAGAKIPLPRSMVDKDLQLRWMQFVRQFRGGERTVIEYLKREGKDPEGLLNEWRADSERRIRLQLVVARMAEKEGIQVQEEELDKQVRKEAEAANLDLEEARQRMEKTRALEVLRYDLKNEKLYNLLLAAAVRKAGRKIKFLDLAQGNY